jgi:hypothetical protein
MELASALQPDSGSYDRKPFSFKRMLGAIVVMLLAGGGVFLYLNPDYRHATSDWVEQKWNRTHEWIDSFQLQKTPQPSRDKPAPTESQSARVEHIDQTPPAPSTPSNGLNAPTDAGNGHDTPGISQPTKPEPKPAQPETPQPSAQEQKQPQQQQPPQAQQPKPADTLSHDAAIAKERELWKRALDAEGKGNYAEALRCFEEIKSLPQSVWPAPLQTRIDNAKRQIGR